MSQATIEVDTFRKGMLAALGHDLRLSATAFVLELAGGALRGEIELGSLRVLGSLSRERLDPSKPSARDRAEIEDNVRREILAVDRFPVARIDATVESGGPGRYRVAGTLNLHGTRGSFEVDALREDESLSAEVPIVPSRFGIAPFRALGGALSLQDRIVVRVRLPWPAAQALAPLHAVQMRWQRSAPDLHA